MVVDVELVLKIAALAMVVSVICSFLKQAGRDEYASMTLLVGLAIVLTWVIPVLLNLFNKVRSVFQLY